MSGYNNICLCSPADYKKSDILKSYSVEEYDQLKKTICHIRCPLVVFKTEIKRGKDSLQLPKLFLGKDYSGVGRVAYRYSGTDRNRDSFRKEPVFACFVENRY